MQGKILSATQPPQEGNSYISNKAFFYCGRLYPKGAKFDIEEFDGDTVIGGLRKNEETAGVITFMDYSHFQQIFIPATA